MFTPGWSGCDFTGRRLEIKAGKQYLSQKWENSLWILMKMLDLLMECELFWNSFLFCAFWLMLSFTQVSHWDSALCASTWHAHTSPLWRSCWVLKKRLQEAEPTNMRIAISWFCDFWASEVKKLVAPNPGWAPKTPSFLNRNELAF